MTKDEAIKLALDALEKYKQDYLILYVDNTITAIREALDEPKQERLAWISEGGDVARSKAWMDEMGFSCSPLYTAPPRREWVSLTDEDWDEVANMPDAFDQGVAWAQARLKEKNHGNHT